MTVHKLPKKKSAKEQLTKAADDLMTAWDLCSVLHGYMCANDHCERCVKAAGVVDLIERRVEKARDRIDAAT